MAAETENKTTNELKRKGELKQVKINFQPKVKRKIMPTLVYSPKETSVLENDQVNCTAKLKSGEKNIPNTTALLSSKNIKNNDEVVSISSSEDELLSNIALNSEDDIPLSKLKKKDCLINNKTSESDPNDSVLPTSVIKKTIAASTTVAHQAHSSLRHSSQEKIRQSSRIVNLEIKRQKEIENRLKLEEKKCIDMNSKQKKTKKQSQNIKVIGGSFLNVSQRLSPMKTNSLTSKDNTLPISLLSNQAKNLVIAIDMDPGKWKKLTREEQSSIIEQKKKQATNQLYQLSVKTIRVPKVQSSVQLQPPSMNTSAMNLKTIGLAKPLMPVSSVPQSATGVLTFPKIAIQNGGICVPNQTFTQIFTQPIHDEELINQPSLPKARPVTMPNGFTSNNFSDVIMVVEFINTFKHFFGTEDIAGISAAEIMIAVTPGSVGSMIVSRILLMFLKVVLGNENFKVRGLRIELADLPLTEHTVSYLVLQFLKCQLEKIRKQRRADEIAARYEQAEDEDPLFDDDEAIQKLKAKKRKEKMNEKKRLGNNGAELQQIISELEKKEFYLLTTNMQLKVLSFLVNFILESEDLGQYYEDIAAEKLEAIRELEGHRKEVKRERECSKELVANTINKFTEKVVSDDVKMKDLNEGRKEEEEKMTGACNIMTQHQIDALKADNKKDILKKKELKCTKEEVEEEEIKEKPGETEKRINEKIKELTRLCKKTLRFEPIGYDRFYRIYWFFGSSAPGLYVNGIDRHSYNKDPPTTVLPSSWSCYDSMKDIDALLLTLASRGIRESKLKAVLRSRYKEIKSNMDAVAKQKSLIREALAVKYTVTTPVTPSNPLNTAAKSTITTPSNPLNTTAKSNITISSNPLNTAAKSNITTPSNPLNTAAMSTITTPSNPLNTAAVSTIAIPSNPLNTAAVSTIATPSNPLHTAAVSAIATPSNPLNTAAASTITTSITISNPLNTAISTELVDLTQPNENNLEVKANPPGNQEIRMHNGITNGAEGSESKKIDNTGADRVIETDGFVSSLNALKQDVKESAERIVHGDLGNLEEFEECIAEIAAVSDFQCMKKYILKIHECVHSKFLLNHLSPDPENTVYVEEWVRSVETASTLSKLHTLYGIFENCVLWEKSAENSRCKVCRRKKGFTQQDYLIICDGCSMAYHSMCLRPPLLEVPNGVWKCPYCNPQENWGRRKSLRNLAKKARASNSESSIHEELCHVCDTGGLMILCDTCPLSYHFACHDPPLRRAPRGSWNCYKCRKALNKKRQVSNARKKYADDISSSSDEESDESFQPRFKASKRSDNECLKRPRAESSRKQAKGETRKRRRVLNIEDSSEEEQTKISPVLGNRRPCYVKDGRKSGVRLSRNSDKDELRACSEIVNKIWKDENAWPFIEPVNLKVAPDYLNIVETPMDFAEIRRKLNSLEYVDGEQFLEDARLVFANSKKYNLDTSDVGTSGLRLSTVFESLVDKHLSSLKT